MLGDVRDKDIIDREILTKNLDQIILDAEKKRIDLSQKIQEND